MYTLKDYGGSNLMNKTLKYPLLLDPLVYQRLWGGTALNKLFRLNNSLESIAEALMLSATADASNIVLNGYMAGRTLKDTLSMWNEPCPEFMVKLIDARDTLSLQVHPDDTYAHNHHGCSGKSEMWYVLDAKDDAKILCGFDSNIDKTVFEKQIRDENIDTNILRVSVTKGDVFYIPAGTVHALGSGIIVAEVQQNSNLTYRLWDWKRTDKNGNARELHIQQALDVINYKYYDAKVSVVQIGDDTNLIMCPYFNVSEITVNTSRSLHSNIRHILCLEGSILLTDENRTIIKVVPGNSVYIPNGLEVNISGSGKLLSVY